MSNGGFGFSFNFGKDDDDDDKNNRNNGNHNPFSFLFGGSGMNPFGSSNNGNDLSSVFGQFGQMLFGTGEFDIKAAHRMALTVAGETQSTLPPNIDTDLRNSAHMAELWLNEVTIFPSTEATPVAWTPKEWINNTIEEWDNLSKPISTHPTENPINNMGGSGNVQFIGLNSFDGLASMAFNTQFGPSLGTLALNILSLSDFGLPFKEDNHIIILPSNFERMIQGTSLNRDEALLYLCAQEIARQRLYSHVPWLQEYVIASIHKVGANIAVDTSSFDEVIRSITETGDPSAIGKIDLNLDSTFHCTDHDALKHLLTLFSLIDGWTNIIVHDALSTRLPNIDQLEKAWARRAETGGNIATIFKSVFNTSITDVEVPNSEELWKKITSAVGVDRRDHVWDHPEFLPTSEDFTNTAGFIDTLLDQSFDPIAEINKLLDEGNTGFPEDEDPEGK